MVYARDQVFIPASADTRNRELYAIRVDELTLRSAPERSPAWSRIPLELLWSARLSASPTVRLESDFHDNNSQGRYVVPDLIVGTYDVQAAKQDFETQVIKQVLLTVCPPVRSRKSTRHTPSLSNVNLRANDGSCCCSSSSGTAGPFSLLLRILPPSVSEGWHRARREPEAARLATSPRFPPIAHRIRCAGCSLIQTGDVVLPHA